MYTEAPSEGWIAARAAFSRRAVTTISSTLVPDAEAGDAAVAGADTCAACAAAVKGAAAARAVRSATRPQYLSNRSCTRNSGRALVISEGQTRGTDPKFLFCEGKLPDPPHCPQGVLSERRRALYGSRMSLRLRTVLAIALVLAIGSLAGLAVAGWQAKQTLREELSAALAGGQQSVAGVLNGAVGSDGSDRDLVRLVSTFDGDRHVQAMLQTPGGRVVARSHPLRARRAPHWFAALFAFPAKRVAVVALGVGAVILSPVAANDVGAIWAEFVGWLAVLGVSFVAGSTFVWLMLGPALRPLADFTAAFQRIGLGDYGVRVGEEGPMELVRLGRAVNQMTGRLQSMQARNQALEHQIANLQEEERADLARDLHDEIGPHLFAVNVDAAMARRLIEDGKASDSLPRVRAIQAATAHMQTLVRDILGRLRPTEVFELGLEAAIAELVDFWRSRRPSDPL